MFGKVTMICKDCQSSLLDLLSAPAAPAHAAVRAHVDSCPDCAREFNSMKATYALLDAWHAPEPSAYFDQKLAVRLREEQAMAPAGWLERIKSRMMFNTGRPMRPALAGGLALLLLVGGGTVLDLSSVSHPQPHISATVQDLQILDKNDQAIQTMDQLLQPDNSGNDPVSPPSS
jgi:anti-sigma factor RsiW